MMENFKNNTIQNKEISEDLDGENIEGYMAEDLEDLEEISDWITAESLETKNHRVFSGFEIYDAIDGGKHPEREVSFVIAQAGSYPQHIHENSDAFFVVIDGEAEFASGEKKFRVCNEMKLKIPRGTPHGFNIDEDRVLKFVSIQNPPIKDHDTGEEDFHLYEKV